ncbi:hypothetical protein MPH_11949 [Macrophomina phaseolina MS6]|uniref:Uncharacterized protein n=1 Tax=Macrophomina phaseolina (strain MS6) TaxID=1126212 RepID=K2QM30_MACPH|nr:hypothetical protein MPH_11949 [Macrophomina phaseolina MS6]
MPIFARSKNSKKATDQPKETPTGKNTSNPAPVRPNLTRASTDVPHGSVAPPKSTYTPQRPSNLRASSSASIRSLPAMPLMTRSAASEPNLPSRGRPSRTNSDLSIDSVMMSRSQSPSPSGRMVLQTRQADFKPTVYTYDPSKAPALVGRKRPHRSYHSKPPTRASSFVRSPHISTMVEENEEVEEQADSSSSSTKSHESDSSTQSQYVEMARTGSNRMQERGKEVPAPDIPARNPARNSTSSRRTSTASNTEAKVDSMTPTPRSDSPEVKSSAGSHTESPGPQSKKRSWFSKKRSPGPIAAH